MATEEQVRLIRVIAGKESRKQETQLERNNTRKNPHSSAQHGSLFLDRWAERERRFEAFCPSCPSLTQAHPLHFHLLAWQRAKVL